MSTWCHLTFLTSDLLEPSDPIISKLDSSRLLNGYPKRSLSLFPIPPICAPNKKFSFINLLQSAMKPFRNLLTCFRLFFYLGAIPILNSLDPQTTI
ncbi:hypothetical protein L596_028906 [Steinernema carpocapsae]|uniref:Uncharacterized protein n=1 Tax=Steinernema carpocapsae TaxID=34508 RepID=A0A4U5LZQ4_STECR|nr:hypothetical protein L596_028906 [Steinernema carpocapsae]